MLLQSETDGEINEYSRKEGIDESRAPRKQCLLFIFIYFFKALGTLKAMGSQRQKTPSCILGQSSHPRDT